MQEEKERVFRLEGIVEQINERLNHIDTEVSELRKGMYDIRTEMQENSKDLRTEMQENSKDLRTEMQKGFIDIRTEIRAEMRDMRTEMKSNFKWMLGIIITMWVTVILTILFK